MAKNTLDQWSSTADDNSDIGGVNIAEGCPPSTINNAIRTVMAQLKAFLPVPANDAAGVNTVGGTAAAITITTTRPYTAYGSSLYLTFKAGAVSTGATTVNVDAIGVKALKKITANGEADIEAGNLVAGGFYTLLYRAAADSGNGAFILLNPTNTDLEQVGDGRYSLLALGAKYLKRDGSLYTSASYPTLAALLPALPDGVTWSNTAAISSGTVRKVVKTGSGYLMMVDDGSSASKVYTAPPAADVWTLVATITSFRVFDFVLNGGTYVAIDGNGKVSRSADGVTWTAPAAVLTFIGIGSIAFAFGLYVVVGDTGKIATSPDGVTWTARTSGVTVFLNKVKLVNGILVAVGGTGTILSSPDGINWTARTSGVTVTLYDVTFGSSLYVVTGGAGTILTSPSLVTWTARSSGTALDLNAIDYSTAGFLIAGTSGVALISTAGTSWAAKSPVTSITFFAVNADPDNPARYFAGGNGALWIGIRTLPTQFQVPNDGANQWIRALA